MTELIEPPSRVEEAWGVELDDFGSVDYYESRADAIEGAVTYRARVVRVVTEFFDVEEADQ